MLAKEQFELLDDNAGLEVRSNIDRGLAKLPGLEPAVILYLLSQFR